MNYYYSSLLHRYFEDTDALKKHNLGFIKKHDAFAKFRMLLAKHQSEDFVALNDGASPVLFILNPDLAFEFLVQDNEVSMKSFPILQIPTPVFQSDKIKKYHFVYQSGPEALEKRAIYTDFFNTQYFERFTPVIEGIISTNISKLLEKFGSMDEEIPALQSPSRNFFPDQ